MESAAPLGRASSVQTHRRSSLRQHRAEAARRGLNPDIWFNNVAYQLALGRFTVIGRMRSVFTICTLAVVVIVPMIAAAWLPPGFPQLLRQVLLCFWGVAAIVVAERMFFTDRLNDCLRAVGFSRAPWPVLVVAGFSSIPMWAFLPLTGWMKGVQVDLRPDWLPLLIGVVMVNGIAEEVIHRGFVFGHLRRRQSFASAATLSALLFGAQHLYIIATTGWTIGLAAVLLAVLLSYPMAFVFERGGNSIVGPALLHTSSNAPVFVFELPEKLMAVALLPHMVVTLSSMYLVFTARKWLADTHGFPRVDASLET